MLKEENARRAGEDPCMCKGEKRKRVHPSGAVKRKLRKSRRADEGTAHSAKAGVPN